MKIYIKSILAFIVFLGLASLTNALVALDNDCPINTSVTNVNITGGTDIFLPFTYNLTAKNDSELVIFTTTDTTELCEVINDSLANFSSGKILVITPKQLYALQTSSCNSTFLNTHLVNFKKSGDVLTSSGTAFCLTNVGFKFNLSVDPEGVMADWDDSGNFTLGSTEYSRRNFKKYMVAYMMNHPTATLTGILSDLADAIGSSLICGGYSSLTTFFNAGKTDFNDKIYDNVLDWNSTAGTELKAASGQSTGVLGWLVNYVLGDLNEPIIKVSNLSSTQKIHLCSLIAIANSQKNTTVTTTNLSVTIDAEATADTTLDITTTDNVTNSTVEIAEYPENPQTAGVVGVIALNKYVGIRMDSTLENALSSVIIKVYYTDAEVSAAGLSESTLRLYYYNETSGSWVKYDPPDGGVDTTANYVWANTTHFSDWGIFGSAPAAAAARRRMVPGGCTIKWNCTEWSECSPEGIQTRTCTNIGTCPDSFSTPEETRTCEYPTPQICYDGVQNQGEEGIDCGGPCKPCPSCYDSIQNQGEEGVDCGGPCPPCPVPEEEKPAVPLSFWLINLIALVIISIVIIIIIRWPVKSRKRKK